MLEPTNDPSLFGYEIKSCPNAEYYSKHTVNLPTYPLLSIKEAKCIVRLTKQWLQNLG